MLLRVLEPKTLCHLYQHNNSVFIDGDLYELTAVFEYMILYLSYKQGLANFLLVHVSHAF